MFSFQATQPQHDLLKHGGVQLVIDVFPVTGVADQIGLAQNGEVLVAVRPEEFVIDSKNESGIDATVISSVFLGLNTTYFVELYDGTQAEIVEESSISSIIPNGTKVKLGFKMDKINVFNADGTRNLTKGVVNDVR